MKILGVFQEDLKQEIDGLPAEQLESVHCGQILQDEDDRWSERGAVPDEREPTYSHSRGQGDLPNDACTESLLKGQRRRGHYPIIGDVSLPIDLFNRLHLG